MKIKNTPAPRSYAAKTDTKTSTVKTVAKTTVPVVQKESANTDSLEKMVATKPKTVKLNPSHSYIGFSIIGKDEKILNFRQGKKNVVACNAVKCIGANATGRRLTVTFHDAQGNQILERKVYKEYFEKMAQTFEVELPE